MRFPLPAFLAALAIAASVLVPAVSAVSSTEAQTLIAGYVGSDNIAQMEVLDSVKLRDVPYYVFYYPPKPVSNNKLVAAVLIETGQVIQDQPTLKTLATAAFQYAVWQRLETSYSLSFSDFSSFVSGFNSRLTAAAPSSTILSVQSTFPSVSMSQVEKKLAAMESRVDLMGDVISQGISLKSQFMDDGSVTNLALLFAHYNKTFASFSLFADSADAYQAAILDVQSKVSSSKNLTVADKQEILKALAAIYDAGSLGQFRDSFEAGREYYDARVLEADAWASDSVSGFLFIKAKADALNSYSLVQPLAQSILQSQVAFTACALSGDWKAFSERWQSIEALRLRATMDAYENMTRQLSQAQADAGSLNERYNNCVSAPQKPVQQDNTNSIIQAALGIIVIALVGFGAYRYYQQKKAEAEGG